MDLRGGPGGWTWGLLEVRAPRARKPRDPIPDFPFRMAPEKGTRGRCHGAQVRESLREPPPENRAGLPSASPPKAAERAVQRARAASRFSRSDGARSMSMNIIQIHIILYALP